MQTACRRWVRRPHRACSRKRRKRRRQPRKTSVRALVLLVSGVGAMWTVTWRRWFKGPLHPAWTWRFELLAEVARRGHERDLGESVETLRRNELPARIHPRLRREVRHEVAATLAGRPAEIFTPSSWTEGAPTVL